MEIFELRNELTQHSDFCYMSMSVPDVIDTDLKKKLCINMKWGPGVRAVHQNHATYSWNEGETKTNQ